MKLAIFAYSRRGCQTAVRTAACFPSDQVQLFTIERLLQVGFQPIGTPSDGFYGSRFSWADGLIFIGSCGIAVRQIAPHIRSKQTDPAVLVIDELGTFVIPLLSGHIGGANELAVQLAGQLNATAVVTTATDINNRFSVDAWASANGLILSDIKSAKAVSAAILEQDVPIVTDFPVVTALPRGIIQDSCAPVGICISYQIKEPFPETLRLIPRIVHLGIGCRRDTPACAIEAAVSAVLDAHRIDIRSIRCVSSIDLKAQEPGLLEFCSRHSLPVSFYSSQELAQVSGEFTPSAFVAQVTGIDNVCERAALMGANQLIVKKTAANGVTVALAAENLEVRFG